MAVFSLLLQARRFCDCTLFSRILSIDGNALCYGMRLSSKTHDLTASLIVTALNFVRDGDPGSCGSGYCGGRRRVGIG
jgi:hypothetical protein